MPRLSLPVVDVRESFAAAMAEFVAEGRGSAVDDSMIGQDLRERGRAWDTAEGFAAFVDALHAQSLEATPRPEGYVPSTTWWWLDGSDWLGRLQFRHRLTPHLLEVGGHIGYDILASARRRGHASAMLAAALPHVRASGVESALITCDVDNVGSRRVIELNGGVLEDERHGKLRFWVPTAP